MKKFITIACLLFAFTLQAQMLLFNVNNIESVSGPEIVNQHTELHIIIDYNEQALKFVDGNNEDWYEEIESRDTIFENRIMVEQIWTTQAYWEVRKYWWDHSYRIILIDEWPYGGLIDNRRYSFK